MEPYVITRTCGGTCDTACVDVCPVDCIHGPIALEVLRAIPPGERGVQLYINPEECVGCGACAPECPVSAIFELGDVPAELAGDVAANAAFFRDRGRPDE